MNNLQILDKENIEKEAAKKLNAIKLQEELYIIPEHVVKSTELDKGDVFSVNKDLVKKIKGSMVEDGDAIIALLKDRTESISTIQIINLNSGDTQDFIYEEELTPEARKEIISSIAYRYKSKDVIVSFYLTYNLEGLKILLESIK